MTEALWRLRRDPGPGRPWKALVEAWGLSEALGRLAWMRGLSAPEDLGWRLDPTWERTHDPYLMAGMGPAVQAIQQAIAERCPITIYGDYDVDGVTATAVMVRTLERLGATVDYFIPNRFSDGYGLHADCIRELAAQGPRLIISVDCGVRSVEEVALGRSLGLTWVITDHHALGEGLPDAPVVHPRVGTYPNPVLAGVGVAFKLAQALLDAVPVPRGAEALFLEGLVKLVALGTIADMVPLEGENALLVRRGLTALEGTNGPGLAALLRVAKIAPPFQATAIAFNLAPRVNAVGRMGEADLAVKLLLSRDAAEAQVMADAVDRLNASRRDIQNRLMQELEPPTAAPFDLVLLKDAHKGVVGIVAAQRMRRTGKPTAVGTILDGVAHCSMRAPEPFDCGAFLDRARPFLHSGGGHRAAAGMTFDATREAFVRRVLNAEAETQALERPRIQHQLVDATNPQELPSAKELVRLEPYGQGFPEPQAWVTGALAAPVKRFSQGHARLRLQGVVEDLTWFFPEAWVEDLKPGDSLAGLVSPQDHPSWGRSWRVETLERGLA